MALVVITLQDEDDSVDCKFLFEPLVKDGENTPAQGMAARMLSAISDSITEDDDAS